MYTVFISLCLVSFVHGSFDLCVLNQNTSCSKQLWPVDVSNDTCQVIYHNRSQCDDQTFKASQSSLDFGRVTLKAYVNWSSTAFNVTLHDIKWKKLRMRFKQRNVKEQCLCRTFTIYKDLVVPSDKYIYFDCPWSEAIYEGKIVDFEYEFGVDDSIVGRKYSFVVPKRNHIYTHVEDIKQFSLFVYVDSSDSKNVIVKIPFAPSKFNITHYEIRIYRTRDNQTAHMDTMIVSISEAKYDEIEYVYSTYGNYGDYFFMVKPVHPNCEAHYCLSKTPVISIPKTSVVLTIGIVSISTLLASILIVLYLWIKHCRRNALQTKEKISVLLVSIPGNDAHTNVVLALETVLRATYNLDVMSDSNVPSTKTKDPYVWFQSAFQKASHIVFLLSQNKQTTTKTVYQNIDNLAKNVVKGEFAKNTSKKQFSLILFPYSTKRIPVELVSFKTFHFMKDFYGFINWLENKSFCERIWAKVDNLSDHYRSKLIDSIKIAENSNYEEEHSDQSDYKLIDVLETKQLIRTVIPNVASENAPEFLYNIDELNLSGINQCENENISVINNQAKYNINDLDL